MEAMVGAEVERFLKKGTLERKLAGDFMAAMAPPETWEDPDDDQDEEDEKLFWELKESREVSDPVLDKTGSSVDFISPKYCSASLTAVE
jgi:hypothetical protein